MEANFTLGNKMSEVVKGGMRFIIMDQPTDINIQTYLKELQRHGVTDVSRACEPGYDKRALIDSGINVHVISFPPPLSFFTYRYRNLPMKTVSPRRLMLSLSGLI